MTSEPRPGPGGPRTTGAGPRSSLHEIYRRHGESVIRSCVRYFTDLDSVRDAAAAAFELAIHELTDGPNPPREPDKLRAWLRAIAKNRCVDELRRLGHGGTCCPDASRSSFDAAKRQECSSQIRENGEQVKHSPLAQQPQRQGPHLSHRRDVECAGRLVSVGPACSLQSTARSRPDYGL